MENDLNSPARLNTKDFPTIFENFDSFIDVEKSKLQQSMKKFDFKESTEKFNDISETFINDVKNFPVIINTDESMDYFITSNILKPFKNYLIQKKFENTLKLKNCQKLVLNLFWLIFVLKYPFSIMNNSNIINQLRKKIKKNYFKMLNLIKSPKEEILNTIIFTFGYICHTLFYIHFPKNRCLFRLRFILDCYHIVIFELNGFYISDYYLQNSFEKIFNSKFLDYQKQNKEKKEKEKPIDNSLEFRNKDSKYFYMKLHKAIFPKTNSEKTNKNKTYLNYSINYEELYQPEKFIGNKIKVNSKNREFSELEVNNMMRNIDKKRNEFEEIYYLTNVKIQKKLKNNNILIHENNNTENITEENILKYFYL